MVSGMWVCYVYLCVWDVYLCASMCDACVICVFPCACLCVSGV